MRDDEIAGQSLIFAQQETAHREHLHLHQHQHQHQHNKIHKRQTASGSVVTEVVAEVIAEVIATVAVVQQIDVNSNGSTIATQTVLADSTADSVPAAVTDSSSPTTTTAASLLIANPGSAASSTVVGPAQPDSFAEPSLSLLSSQSAVSVPTSTLSIPTSFASLIVSSNSTTLISSSSSLLPTFSNSTISSSSRSLLTSITSSSSPSSSDGSSITSTSSLYSPSSSSQSTLASGIDGILAGGTGIAPGSAPSSTAASGSSSDSGTGSIPPAGVVAGGVVGGLAGAAVIIFLLMFILRWKKRNMNMLPLGSSGRDGGADTLAGGGPSKPSHDMVERRSFAYAVPAALASLTGYKRSSQKTETDRTISSTAGSEQGFYRVSGRKLPSVLQTGGDGYGGGFPDTNTLSGSSFYRDSQGFYGGPGSPSSPPAGMSTKRESGVPIMRPSPARTPVTEHSPFTSTPPPLNQPRRPDQLGRSRPSQDGSHTSKFTEEV